MMNVKRRDHARYGTGRVAAQVAAAAGIFALPVLLAGPAKASVPLPAGGATIASASTGSSGSSGGATPSLGGFNINADGNAVDILIDNTTGLAGIHPLSEADFPEAQSQFATGPFGSGLATVFWPGSAGGNFGSLSGELGFPSQLQPIASQLNDPIKASAQYPAGPATSDYPAGAPGGAAIMHATAASDGVTSEGSVFDESPTSVLSFSSAKGTSSTTATNTAKAVSSTDLSDVSILGGLIDIGSISSTADALSDGSKGSGSALTQVNDVTVLGQKASIGSNGLVLPDFTKSLGPLTGPLVQKAISQVISGMGLTITEFPSTQAGKGAGFNATSGGVSIGIIPPSSVAPILEQAASVLAPLFPSQAAIIPTLPGLLQGLNITITLGRATASANASQPFSTNFNFNGALAPVAPGSGGTGSAAVAPGSTAGTGGGLSPTVAGTPGSNGSTDTGGNSPGTGGTIPFASLVSVSTPLGAGAVALAILLTLAAGYGLWRLGRMVLPSDAGPVCPLGHDQN